MLSSVSVKNQFSVLFTHPVQWSLYLTCTQITHILAVNPPTSPVPKLLTSFQWTLLPPLYPNYSHPSSEPSYLTCTQITLPQCVLLPHLYPNYIPPVHPPTSPVPKLHYPSVSSYLTCTQITSPQCVLLPHLYLNYIPPVCPPTSPVPKLLTSFQRPFLPHLYLNYLQPSREPSYFTYTWITQPSRDPSYLTYSIYLNYSHAQPPREPSYLTYTWITHSLPENPPTLCITESLTAFQRTILPHLCLNHSHPSRGPSYLTYTWITHSLPETPPTSPVPKYSHTLLPVPKTTHCLGIDEHVPGHEDANAVDDHDDVYDVEAVAWLVSLQLLHSLQRAEVELIRWTVGALPAWVQLDRWKEVLPLTVVICWQVKQKLSISSFHV